jgi:ABC-2 type transport system permease protein
MNEPPPLEAFGLVNTARSEMTRGIALGGVYLFGFLAFLLGASFIAAEFGSGSMGTWLTFQPGRLRVGTAKLVAATGGGLAIGALGVGLAALGAFLVTTVNRPDSPLGLPEAPAVAGDSLAQTLLRVTAAVALGGLGGAVIALIVRATAGVIGIVVGYSVVAEGFLANELGGGRLQPWLVRLNLESFLDKGARYFVTVCGDSDCTSKQLTNSYTHGWVYLLVLAVVGVTAALAVFRRRDVS